MCRLNIRLLFMLCLLCFSLLPVVSQSESQSVTITLSQYDSWMIELATLRYSLQAKQIQLDEWQMKLLISAQEAEALQIQLTEFQKEIEKLEKDSELSAVASEKILQDWTEFSQKWNLRELELQKKIKALTTGAIITPALAIITTAIILEIKHYQDNLKE